MIRIDRLWLCSTPVDMRAGAERLLACVVQVTGAAHAHHVAADNYLERSATTIVSG